MNQEQLDAKLKDHRLWQETNGRRGKRARFVQAQLNHLTGLRGIDFSGCLFTHSILIGLDFTDCDLTGARFNDSILDYSTFNNAKMAGVDFSRAKGKHVTAIGADMTKAKMECFQLDNSNLTKSTIDGVTVTKRNGGNGWHMVILDDGSAKEATFVEMGISCMYGRRADFHEAEFADCRITNSLFHESKFTNANFHSADIRASTFKLANLIGACFEWAEAKGNSFEAADLTDTDFRNANLKDCNMRKVTCDRTDFEGAEVHRMKTKGMNYHVANICDSQIKMLIP